MTLELTAAELVEMRESVEAHLPDGCAPYTITYAIDEAGGTTETIAMRDLVPCRLAPITSRAATEQEIASRLGIVNPWVVTMPSGTIVAENERLLVVTPTSNRTMQVATVMRPRSEELDVRAILAEVR